jgi:hypothetical protein
MAEGQQPWEGTVHDRSTGGLCLHVSRPAVVGSHFLVRSPNAPEEMPWVEVQVRNCRKTGNTYLIGCEFVEAQPWSVLLLFG